MKWKMILQKGRLGIWCAILAFGNSACINAQSQKLHLLDFKTPEAVQAYFRYDGGKTILVSGHRGGQEEGYAENCIEGFENVLRQMPAIFEIDPRLTKDSVIVLMHDATLDRTTNARGKLNEYTWEQLQSVRLKDHSGKVTSCRIPRLEDAIRWSKGKTILNLDKKDVPLEKIAALIRKHKAEKHVMLTVHTGAQARYYYDRIPDIMMSAFVRNWKEFEDIDISGVPWSHFIAYVGPTLKEENKALYDTLHAKGVRCMISTAPTHDRLPSRPERAQQYREEISKLPDIIESDIPTEVWEMIPANQKTH